MGYFRFMNVKFFNDGMYYSYGMVSGVTTIIYDEQSKHHMSEWFYNYNTQNLLLIQAENEMVHFKDSDFDNQRTIDKKSLNISCQIGVFDKLCILDYQEENKIEIGDIVYKKYLVVSSQNLLYRTYYKLINIENQDLSYRLLYCNINKCFYGTSVIETVSTNTLGNNFGSKVRSMFETQDKNKISFLEFDLRDYVIRSE
jgi:hypothetical protein